VYRFRYRGSPVTQIGLMADDVERTAPESVAVWGGFKVVDYELATRGARGKAELARLGRAEATGEN
jgi:hypothetical protein